MKKNVSLRVLKPLSNKLPSIGIKYRRCEETLPGASTCQLVKVLTFFSCTKKSDRGDLNLVVKGIKALTKTVLRYAIYKV